MPQKFKDQLNLSISNLKKKQNIIKAFCQKLFVQEFRTFHHQTKSAASAAFETTVDTTGTILNAQFFWTIIRFQPGRWWCGRKPPGRSKWRINYQSKPCLKWLSEASIDGFPWEICWVEYRLTYSMIRSIWGKVCPSWTRRCGLLGSF